MRGWVLGLWLAGCASTAQVRTDPPADPVQEEESDRLFAQGAGLAARGDYVRAEQYLAASISRGYSEEAAMPLLLHTCIAALRLRVAVEYAEPYLSRHPEDWRLRHLTASLYAGLGEPQRARAHLEKVLEDQPDAAESHYLFGTLLREEFREKAEARAHFARYVELAPEGSHADEVRDLLARADAESAAENEQGNAAPAVPRRISAEPHAELGREETP